MVTTDDPARLLDEVNRLRGRARSRAHGGAWFPVALLAALLLASIALYEYPFARPHGLTGELRPWAGLPDQERSAAASYAFWFLGTPLVFAACAAWYRWRGRRVGARVAWWPFVATGLGALVAMAVIAAFPTTPRRVPADLAPQDMYGWQAPLGSPWLAGLLSPLVAVALALVVLGWIERSPALAVAGGWVGLVAWYHCAQVWRAPCFGLLCFPGGQVTLLRLDRPGPMLVALALPLLVFVAVRTLRAAR